MIQKQKYKAKVEVAETAMESISNYMETLVFAEVKKQVREQFGSDLLKDHDLIADVTCVALNNTPPRYVRNQIDLSFYMTSHESRLVEAHVRAAVTMALQLVLKRT